MFPKFHKPWTPCWHRWLPSSGYAPIEANSDVPYMFERYGEGFNPQTESGDIEIWIPLQA
jgi:AraC family transcriptional regulator